MGISFKAIHLKSKDMSKLYHFLSFVFDLEDMIEKNKEIHFRLFGQKFILSNSDGEINSFSGFSLEFDSKSELVEFKQLLEFYNYKEAEGIIAFGEQEMTFYFTDTDGRRWEIDYPREMPKQKHDHIAQSFLVQM